MGPLIGSDHGEGVFAPNTVEVVALADDGFEVDVGFVDELVPVEVLDGGDVFLAHLEELLLEVALDLADATGFESGKVVGDDLRAQGGDRIGHKSPFVDDGVGRKFVHKSWSRCQRIGIRQMGIWGAIWVSMGI